MEFPPVRLAKVTVEVSPRYSYERDVQPWADRQPNQDWCFMFHEAAEATPGLNWKGAGVATCHKDEVESVELLLHQVADQANERFAKYLSTASPRDAAEQLLALEQINAASVDPDSDDGYWIKFP